MSDVLGGKNMKRDGSNKDFSKPDDNKDGKKKVFEIRIDLDLRKAGVHAITVYEELDKSGNAIFELSTGRGDIIIERPDGYEDIRYRVEGNLLDVYRDPYRIEKILEGLDERHNAIEESLDSISKGNN
jgi:hypothetical protein